MTTLRHDSKLPDSISFEQAFKRMFSVIVDFDYQMLNPVNGFPMTAEEADDLKSEVSNAVHATMVELGYEIDEIGEYMGTLYDWAEETGCLINVHYIDELAAFNEQMQECAEEHAPHVDVMPGEHSETFLHWRNQR